jgi:Na/Pi-cotransporter
MLFSQLQLTLTIISAILLFLHGLQGFSHEIQNVGAEKLRKIVSILTSNRWRGFAMGAFLTMLIQSSSAVSAIALTLVESGVLTFRNSLGVIFGANVGTTATAWLVTWKLTGLGPFFIVLGGLVGALPYKVRMLGKALFYFGFIFFALGLIESTLGPLRESQQFRNFLLGHSTYFSVFVGALFTAIIQSSSVTSGLVIVMVQQGIMPMSVAIAIIIGANLGTTSTSLIASIPLGTAAKRTALANFLFNSFGVILFTSLLSPFVEQIARITTRSDLQVAYAHLIFNLSNSFLFLLALKPFENLLLRLVPKNDQTTKV